MVKNLYKGVFKFPHTGYTIIRAAHSEKQAALLMARAIAKKQDVHISTVLKWMSENKKDYLIKLEIEWKET